MSPENIPNITYETRDSLIEKIKLAGIERCIDPAIGIDTNSRIIELCEDYPGFVYGAVGLHPKRAAQTDIENFSLIEELSQHRSVVAIGETGLDYSYDGHEADKSIQQEWFVKQLELADKYRLPLVLHIRDAYDDAANILQSFSGRLHGGVCHCFNGGVDEAIFYTQKLGLALGIGASIFYDEREILREAVRLTPLEYLFLETDGPYVKIPYSEGMLSEIPETLKRDKNYVALGEYMLVSKKKWKNARNSSLIIPAIAAEIASIKGISIGEVERSTTENAEKIFKLKSDQSFIS